VLIEAGLIAANRAPGLTRTRYGFEAWQGHDAEAYARYRTELAAQARPLGKLRLIGSDLEPERIEDTQRNLEAAGFDPDATNFDLSAGDALDMELKPGWNAFLATNPPYGQRVGDVGELLPLFQGLGHKWRAEAAGYELSVLSGEPKLTGALGLPELTRTPVMNGAIECELLGGRIAEREDSTQRA
jgi:23S rRNA (guanine2445-N2)-methyltransferase / 23S rRNA (guanine2069-N7)-methyltransferase